MAQRYRILIVEDHEPEWLLYRAALEPLECVCEFCKSGTEALEHIKAHQYDLLFFDVGLPQVASERNVSPMDDLCWGERIFSELKALYSGPIIVVTVHRVSFPGADTIGRMAPSMCLDKVVPPDAIREAALAVLRRTEDNVH